MKTPTLDFLPSLFVAIGLFGAVAVFVSETNSFRDAVFEWARRDLEARAELASSTLKEAVETGDFRRIHEFGEESSAKGVRLTVMSAPGGIVFDSQGRGAAREDSVFAVRPCGEFRVRLGLPVSRVLAPYRRARTGFLLAGIVGAVGVLFVILFTFRQRARLRELARERDSQCRLVEEMRKVEEFRRNFIADVSHEIKTPLTGIIGSVDLLSAPEALPSEARERLFAMLKSESGRLNTLVQGILSLAEIESGAASGAPAFLPADVCSVVEETVTRLSVQAAEKGVVLKTLLPGPCVVLCDAHLLAGAVSNLVTNALLHSGSDEVIVSVSRGADFVTVAVEDHGIGIPAEERERIFDRFHRVDRSRDSATGGSGLGLSIVRGVARLHGGDAVVESEPGVKTVFSFTLRPG